MIHFGSIAEGGYQVGELAKCYFPNGHDITTLDYEEAKNKRTNFLKQEKVIIYELQLDLKTFCSNYIL